ncbi:phosphoribosylamine-glycine ligase [Dictyostelium purpureum]|uniref:Phosphoribosylamine-glycine ligase n=1 Tax=Dictyostelium purpureum TaxID=5786 RepID=F0ZJ35_DICPU|nr:phosphoribosylamine-glycine ligase [Dictyostelium purpureum]EGC36041.1 phosphoribosylamine-glycine ligase [Dictyostelium purpureum]|eukprot:XP_003287416.1 phosphoribosylamine-glycine ligase [Dictyostelium purpureum]
MKNNILVIGSGSREHAITWKLLQSKDVDKVILVPGNAANATMDRVISVQCSKIDGESISNICKDYNVELVFVGPEVPLVDGIADQLKRKGISCFGPSMKAAEIEGSKVFCKDFMARNNIPTATYQTFTDYNKAKEYIETLNYNIVLKASGCAAGKGVLIPKNKEEALNSLKRIMIDKEFGSAGDEIVIEEFLDGEECSLMCFSDGYSCVVMPPAQDHKRVFDNDQGPNTGGMGAYAPAPFVINTKSGKGSSGFGSIIDRCVESILKPTINGMRKEGRPFVGVLFAGLMVNKQNGDIKVLEFNCRMGDPETQVVLPLLETDLYEIVSACCDGRLDSINVKWSDKYAVTVVAASKGYPDSYPKGIKIQGLENNSHINQDNIIFQAGTIKKGDEILTNGGRVLSVTALSTQLEDAIQKSYTLLKTISFDGMHYRSDIGQKALNHLKEQKEKQEKSVSYSESGVDIERGDAVVDNIGPLAKMTSRLGCVSDLGGFGALFDTKAAGFKDPILVSGTDGVGTKLKIAQELGRHDTIGIDLVAMCVNDVVVQGAEPLFFLDYFATGRIHVNVATQVVAGIAKGCKDSGCALIGGETAEMPGMYKDGEYDLAGFSVGAVERTQMLPKNIAPGNVLLGLASSGVHSNGYSLVRYLIEKKSGLTYSDKAPFDSSKTLGEVLLTPTKLYVLSCLAAIKAGGVNGLAHITGGGITENLPRVIPDGLDCEVKLNSWEILPIFKYLNQLGNMEITELLKTFNCGIGMILIVDQDKVSSIKAVLESMNETVYEIGKVVQSNNKNQKSKVVYN